MTTRITTNGNTYIRVTVNSTTTRVTVGEMAFTPYNSGFPYVLPFNLA